MKVCHYLPGDMEGGGYPKIMTNGHMGGGGSVNGMLIANQILHILCVFIKLNVLYS